MFVTPVDGRFVSYVEMAAALRRGRWHLHVLCNVTGLHAGLIAIRKPNGRTFFFDLHADNILTQQLAFSLLPPKVGRRLVELMVEHDHDDAKVKANVSTSLH